MGNKMKLLGYNITRDKIVTAQKSTLSYPNDSSRGWYRWGQADTYTGQWQQDYYALSQEQVLAYSTLYGCVTLISNQISKLPLNLYEYDENGTKVKLETSPYNRVLTRPAPQYNRITWMAYLVNCLMITGNAYAIKSYDESYRVKGLHLLFPETVVPLISENGEVFYQIQQNKMAGIPDNQITVPSSQMAHFRINPFYHPMVGCSPVHSALTPTKVGSALLDRELTLHQNRPQLGGTLHLPMGISAEQVREARETWDATAKTGLAVLESGIEFKPLMFNSQEMETIAAMNKADEQICRALGVPKHLVGVGDQPTVNNSESIMRAFYDQTLQPIMEQIEETLQEALNTKPSQCIEFDVKRLARLDMASRYTTNSSAIQGGWKTINEVREEEGLPHLEGGDTTYHQQQMFPLQEIAQNVLPTQGGQDTPQDGPADPEDDQEDPEEDSSYRGLYDDEDKYEKGQMVTYQGTLWFCKSDTTTQPGQSSDWQLMVKRAK